MKNASSTPEFDEWLLKSENRFNRNYIDARLQKEQRKQSGLVKQESRPFKSQLSVRRLAPKLLRVSGLATFGRKQANKVRKVEHTLSLNKLPKAFNGYRLLQISDLHFNNSAELSASIFSAIAEAEYDFCVLTGDYRYRSFGPIDDALEGLQQLRSAVHTDIAAILGNHDSLYMVPSMESMGITVLLNESMHLTKGKDSIALVGVDDPSYYRTHDLNKALAHDNAGDTLCTVLLAHAPNIIQEAIEKGVSGYLCGHTHGGQICLPGGYPMFQNVRCSQESFAGAWQIDGLSGYTSVGAGVSVVEARFFCPPEITVHTLAPG